VVGAAYAMNAWNRAIFDALQNRDSAAVARLSLLYFSLFWKSCG
jgi:vitamin B12/bleomycin/antimicrobial peptide transport system ATP-binding/permease protein